MRWIGAIVLLLVSLAAARADDSWLIGRWYGKVDEPGKNLGYEWLLERRADGTYVGYSRSLDGRCSDQTGTWSFDGAIYVANVRTASARRTPWVDHFRLLGHSDDAAEFFWLELGIKQHAMRVGPDFTLKDCPAGKPSV